MRGRGIIIAVLLLLLTGILIFNLIEYPRFIELDIPSPMSYLPNGGWYYTAYTTLVTQESYQRYFIWRRDGRAYGKSDSFNFDSEANVLSFFEGESEHGPLCPSCAETLTSISPDGEYELKDEFKGKIVYNDYVERYEKGPLDDVILGFILN